MPVSRRSFVATVGTTLGAGATGLLGAPLVSWRGREDLFAQQGAQQPASAGVEARRADRLLATRPGMIRIDSNENPNGPGKHALDAIAQHLNESNRYPVKGEDDLLQVLAKVHGLKAENFILGCGSGELLRAAVFAFTSPTRALVAP
jgi:histidinol-phosphate/aromatic aminotransferase/cobyric acid decarboxylase-like protein